MSERGSESLGRYAEEVVAATDRELYGQAFELAASLRLSSPTIRQAALEQLHSDDPDIALMAVGAIPHETADAAEREEAITHIESLLGNTDDDAVRGTATHKLLRLRRGAERDEATLSALNDTPRAQQAALYTLEDGDAYPSGAARDRVLAIARSDEADEETRMLAERVLRSKFDLSDEEYDDLEEGT